LEGAPIDKQNQTLESFDYQWKNLSDGPHLLSDEKWRDRVSHNILDELNLNEKEIAGKRVLDAGCGQGRWAYGFVKLNCETHGFDPSEHGIEYARKHVPCASFNVANVLDYQRLQKLYPENSFDIVWCWGVLHHTGNPELGFKNLTKFVKPGGRIHLYIYGKKIQRTKLIRKVFGIFPLSIRKILAKFLAIFLSSSAHSNFDMFSPSIASNHTESEVKKWYADEEFSFKRVYPSWALGSTDIFTSGLKHGGKGF